MIAILTLKFKDSGLTKDDRTEVKTYEQVICLDVNQNTGFLTIQTKAGDFAFDPQIWHSFIITRDE